MRAVLRTAQRHLSIGQPSLRTGIESDGLIPLTDVTKKAGWFTSGLQGFAIQFWSDRETQTYGYTELIEFAEGILDLSVKPCKIEINHTTNTQVQANFTT